MKYRLNAISILILLIVMMASVLSVLGVVSASAEYKTSQKQAEYATAMQLCSNQAQAWIAQGGAGERTFTDGAGHCLYVQVEETEDGPVITEYKCYTEWTDAVPEQVYKNEE